MESRSRAAVIIGIVLYLIVGYFYLFTGLMAPVPWVAALWIVWVGGLMLIVRWRTRRPYAVLIIPFAAMGLWMLVLWLGDQLLGWTA